MTRSALMIGCIAALVTASGCARRPMYDWGSYNGAVARLYSGSPDYRPEEDIEALATEIEQSPPGKVPPGKAAHVGFLYSMQGNNTLARRYFELEKKLFPEATTLMNRLIKTL